MKRESTGRILLGAGTGVLFGFLLNKGRVSEHKKISDQLLLQDATVVKIMGTASLAGALGTQILKEFNLADAKIKPLNTGGIVLGGALFGAGMALLGYCPGTGMAAIGAGRTDAIAGALGMFGGALSFVKLYPHIRPVLEKGAKGKKTLPELTNTNPWPWIIGGSLLALAGAEFLEKRKSV